MLAKEHGYTSDDKWVEYESDWAIEVFRDCTENDNFWKPWSTPEPEHIKKSLKRFRKMLYILEDRFSDGRRHAAGPSLTAADFVLLGADCSFISNPYAPAFTSEFKSTLQEYPNVKRVIEKVKSENGLTEYISSKNYTF